MSDTNDSAQLNWRDAALAGVVATVWFLLVRPGGFDLPFFWDEADVYVPGSRWVAENGLNVTPGVFPDDYSRGHPPLLYLLAGAAFALFGATPTVAHLLILPFGVIALAATYGLGATLFCRRTGVAAALMLGCTPLFMTMGNMLLPEMPLTTLAVVALFAFARGRMGVVALTGCAAVLIKETGIFSAGAVGAALLYDAHRSGVLRTRESLRRIALALTPLFALVLFFVWQRSTAGYFIFPHHQGLFTDRPMTWANLITVVPSLFAWHGRWLVSVAALVAAVFLRRQTADSPRTSERWQPRRASVYLAALLLVAFNWVFFAKMFWLERYALPAHPGLLVLLCGALFSLAKGNARLAGASALVLGASVWGLYGMFGPAERDAEEHTFAYADVIASHRGAIDSLTRDGGASSERFVVTTWPMSVELRYPYLGYVDAEVRATEFQYLSEGDHDAVTHVVVNSASSQADRLVDFARSQGLVRHAEFQTGDAPRLVVYARPER
ncbi:MAG: ArnT family glycosyltransferase [Polyangiales bacterium]